MLKFNLYRKTTSIKLILCLLFIIWFSGICFAQQKIADSLKREIYSIKNTKGFTKKDTTYVNLINSLAYQLTYYNIDSVLHLSNEALKISSSTNYKKGKSKAIFNLGVYYYVKSEHQNSLIELKKALAIAEEINNTKIIINIYNFLGITYTSIDDYANALNSYLKGLKIADNLKDNKSLSIFNSNIALLYSSQQDYEQALYFYDKATEINNRTDDKILIAQPMSNMASIYADIGEYNKAMLNINESIKTFKKENIYDWLAHAYKVKGKIYLTQKKYKWAINWLEESLLLHNKIEDNIEKIQLLNYLAEAYLGIKKNNLSKKYALEVYHKSLEINNSEHIQKAAKTLYLVCKSENNISEALKYHEIFQETSEFRAKNINTRGLTMLKAKIAYEEQEKKLIQQNKKELKKKQNYIYLVILITLISFFVIALILKSRKVHQKLNTKLNKQKLALIKRETELKNSNETKNMLFSIIGHDLRGPIGALEALLNLFKMGDLNSSDFLNMIPKLQKDVNHISFTLNNLLSWSLTQMNGANTNPTKLIFNELVNENINFLNEISTKKTITINNILHDRIQIWSDRNQVDIIVRNLLSNALKFTPKNGTITIKSLERDNSWVISIEDTGVGMDKYTQEKIFKKDTNITTYGTNNEKGTGIGLSLCKDMVEKNNGTIWVESTLNKGSIFFFTLPKRSLEKAV